MIATILLAHLLAAPADSTAADSIAAVGAAPATVRADSSAVLDTLRAERPVLVLPEVRVERERLSEERRRLPTASVTELRLGEAGRSLETLSEVLMEAAGVRITQYGGLGAFSTISLRGAPPGQVSVFLDGVPLTSASHGIVSLSDLPVTAIERVEVYRGSAPLAFGAVTPAGAVNLVTRGASEVRELRLTRGAFDTWEARGSAGARRGPVSGMVHLGYLGSEGDFRYEDDNGTPFNPADDSLSLRRNDRIDALSGLAQARVRLAPGLELEVREDLFRKAMGLPGLGAVPALNARLALLRSVSQVDLSASLGNRWIPGARLSGSLGRERTRFRDTEAQLGLGTHDTDDHGDDDNLALELEWPREPAARVPLGARLTGAASLRSERARPTDRLDGVPDPPGSRRLGRGATVGVQLAPLAGRVVLHAARRWDRLTSGLNSVGVGGIPRQSGATSEFEVPQLGVLVAGPLGTRFTANWTRGDRPPDFLELFGNAGFVLGNPTLRPEHGETWDAGASWSRRLFAKLDGSLEWAHFESRFRDLVLYVRTSQSSVRAQNVAAARIRGEELTARLGLSHGLAASGSFTWQSALDQGPYPIWRGKRLPQRPGRQAYARIDWLGRRLRLTTDLQYMSDNYLDPSNRQRVPSRTLVSSSIAFTPMTSRVRLTLEGKNLGNSRVADVGGYPLPGRSAFASCQVSLGPSPSGSP